MSNHFFQYFIERPLNTLNLITDIRYSKTGKTKNLKRRPGKLSIHLFEILINSLPTSDEIAEFVNSVDLDEVAHNEPPHLDRHCLPSSL